MAPNAKSAHSLPAQPGDAGGLHEMPLRSDEGDPDTVAVEHPASVAEQSMAGRSLQQPARTLEPPTLSFPPVVSTLEKALTAAILNTRREPYRRLQICSLRLGFDAEAATLEVVGAMYGVTRERVRQIVDRVLKEVSKKPVVAAFRSQVKAVLTERDCVSVSELTQLSPWFGTFRETGMKVLLDEFLPGCVRNSFVTLGSHDAVAAAIKETVKRIADLQVEDRAYAAVDAIASEAASAAGLPQFQASLASFARERLSRQRFSFSAFVRDYVERSAGPVSLGELKQAAAAAGKTAISDGFVRNALANCTGVFPLGDSTFGTFAQIFSETTPDLDSIAAEVVCLVENEPERQHHADELLAHVRKQFGSDSDVVGDAYQLSALLRHKTTLRYLGRLVFSTSAHIERLELLPLAQRILEEAGGPLTTSELLEGMRAQRGVGPHSMQAVLARLAEIRPGLWGLPGRDDIVLEKRLAPPSADAIAKAILVEDAFAALRPSETLHLSELRGRVGERGSDEAEYFSVAQFGSALGEDGRFILGPRGTIRLSQTRHVDRFAS